MGKCYVDRDGCATVACHAGWYAYAAARAPAWEPLPDGRGTERLLRPGTAEPDWAGWSDGAYRMARDLGFRNSGALVVFAGGHPRWWGNDDGGLMFAPDPHGSLAPGDGPLTLGQIAEHWRGVAARTPQ